jgi:tetratricopeptide (TPR) repeat protein
VIFSIRGAYIALVLAISQSIASYATDHETRVQQVRALAEAGKWVEAETALEQGGTASSPEELFWKSYIQFKTGRYAASASSARTCLQQRPDDGQARKVLGLDLFMLGDAAAAEAELERAVALLPNDEEALYYLGRVYFTRQNMPAALLAFERVLGVSPNSVRAHNHLGQTLEALNRSEEAQAEYEKAVRLDRSATKHSEWPYYNLGVLHLKVGHGVEAAQWFRQALQAEPQFVEAKVKLATAIAQSGDAESARQLLESVIAQQPDNADAHYQLGRLYLKLRDPSRAEAHLRRFQALRAK